ncbi:MAG: hypothetical protein KO464_09920 [Candidatus Methanofastidiosum sp.]|nr:hypothetical protein [Methanofastidiosum sp.]
MLNVKFYDFATQEESEQIRPVGILFEEKQEQALKLCYKIEGKEEKCIEGKNSALAHTKTTKDTPIVFR